jgi:hypothetical protein
MRRRRPSSPCSRRPPRARIAGAGLISVGDEIIVTGIVEDPELAATGTPRP